MKTKVIKRNDRWVVQVQDKQGKYKQVGSFATELLAEKQRELVKDNFENAVAAVSNLTVVEAFKKYSDYKFNLWNTYNSLTEHQAKLYINRFKNWILPYFPKNILLRNLASQDLKDFFIVLLTKGYTWKQTKTLIYSFKGMFEWCILEKLARREDYSIEYFELNKYPELKPNDGSDKSKKTTMITMSEIRKLHQQIKPKDKNNYSYDELVNFIGISIFMYTGARPAEVRGIKWSNVNFQTRRIKIDTQVHNDEKIVNRVKAAGSLRTLVMPSKLFEYLFRFKEKQLNFIDNPEWVLQGLETKKPITDKQLRNFLWRSYAAIGLAIIEDTGQHVTVRSSKFKDAPFKTFRHFVSTALLNAQGKSSEMNENFIKNFIGHKDSKTTRMIYGDHNDLHTGTYKDGQIMLALDNALEDIQ